MEVSSNLLVALMFVTILTLGIANLITALSDHVVRREKGERRVLLSGWKIALLVAHFNLFWHTLDLLSVEDWSFGDFLFVEAGPILMFFAVTSLLGSDGGAPTESSDAAGVSLPVPARFFGLLCLVQVWTALVDILYGSGFEGMTALTLAVGALLAVAALYRTPLTQTLVSALIWVVFAGTVVLRSSGAID